MAANYLHGAEVIEVMVGTTPIRVVKSAVIALVGTASRGPVNTLTWVKNSTDAEQFGDWILEGRQGENFTIAKSLKAIFDQGNANVLVVNVANATANDAAIVAESHVVDTAGNFKTTFVPFQTGTNAVTVTTNASPVVALVENTDYTHDGYGNFTMINGAGIDIGDTVLISYSKCDFSTIIASTIIGTVNSSTGARTGLKCYATAFTDFGFKPKMFVIPTYSELTTVAAQMQVEAAYYKAIAFIDAPYGTSVTNAILGRGISGSINFNTTDERAGLCYDDLKVTNPADVSTTYDKGSLSVHYAAAQAATDYESGYWFSASNRELRNVFGTKFPKAGNGFTDPSSDANALNEVGIITMMDIRTWGNRSAAWPSRSDAKTFIAVRRTFDIVHESLELAMLPFIDKPITLALIDAIRESGNSFIRSLVKRGALVEGSKIVYDPAKNPAEQISLGNLVFDFVGMVSVPGERITFLSFMEPLLLNNLNAAA